MNKIPEHPQLETDPEVSAKRTAQMQQMAHQSQTASRNLTIIWDDEKAAILERLTALESRVLLLEHNVRLPNTVSPAPPASR